MIRGFVAAQLEHDWDEGPDKLLPFGMAQCAVCNVAIPADDLQDVNGTEVCDECLTKYCLTHCAEYEFAYACGKSQIEDFVSWFWRQLSSKDKAILIRMLWMVDGGNKELYNAMIHRYCELHSVDFTAFCVEEMQ